MMYNENTPTSQAWKTLGSSWRMVVGVICATCSFMFFDAYHIFHRYTDLVWGVLYIVGAYLLMCRPLVTFHDQRRAEKLATRAHSEAVSVNYVPSPQSSKHTCYLRRTLPADPDTSDVKHDLWDTTSEHQRLALIGLNATDRCDKCSAQARVKATKDDLTLIFCAHHYHEISTRLARDGWTTLDADDIA